MPSLITHYLFSETNYHPTRAFIIGSQGPDPFFYYGYTTPWKKHIKEVRDFGTYLHNIDSYKMFKFLMEYEQKNDNESKVLLEFIKGMLSHYVLDRVCHPFIFYRTGFPLSEHRFSYNHSKYEDEMDVYYEEKLKYYPTYKEVVGINKKDLLMISKMMHELSLYLDKKYIDEKTFYRAVRTMKTANNIINSKVFGFRKFLFSHLLKRSVINTMSHPFYKKMDKSVDVENNKHEEWRNFEDNSLMGNDSIYDLFDKAKMSLDEGFKLLDNFENDPEKLNIFINKINHNGIKVGHEMKYYNVVYK